MESVLFFAFNNNKIKQETNRTVLHFYSFYSLLIFQKPPKKYKYFDFLGVLL